MAYKTLTGWSNPDDFQAADAAIDNYIASQMTAGNTDGVGIGCYRVGIPYDVMYQFEWANEAAATAYINFCNGLPNAPQYTAVLPPL